MFVSSAFVITVCRKLSLPPLGIYVRHKIRLRGGSRNKFWNKKITRSSFQVPRNAKKKKEMRKGEIVKIIKKKKKPDEINEKIRME